MGLFDKFKKEQPKAAPVQPAPPKPKVEPDKYFEKGGYKFHFPVDESEKTAGWTVSVSLNDKNLKMAVADQEYVKNVYLWHEENLIRGLEGDKVIFEVTNRSKAYAELLPYARRKAKGVTITKREGAHGTFYSVSVKFEIVIDDSGMQYT